MSIKQLFLIYNIHNLIYLFIGRTVYLYKIILKTYNNQLYRKINFFLCKIELLLEISLIKYSTKFSSIFLLDVNLLFSISVSIFSILFNSSSLLSSQLFIISFSKAEDSSVVFSISSSQLYIFSLNGVT